MENSEKTPEKEVIFLNKNEDIIQKLEYYIEKIKESTFINEYEESLDFDKGETEISFRIKFL